jgi:hypothetical protein
MLHLYTYIANKMENARTIKQRIFWIQIDNVQLISCQQLTAVSWWKQWQLSHIIGKLL